jgi:hypothetical protein
MVLRHQRLHVCLQGLPPHGVAGPGRQLQRFKI